MKQSRGIKTTVLACEKRARARIHREQLMEPARVGEVHRECMRNHAARLGAYASDGCCEYTPDALHPNMMFCTACGCHRNFHRKVPTPPPPAASTSEGPGTAGEILRARRRRRRTKFTAQQKARMAGFAAQIGWKVQKRDDDQYCGGQDEVSRFCEDVGITREVFKIWIHNHKRTGAAAGTSSAGNTSTAAGADWEGSEGGGGSEGPDEVEEEIKGSASKEEEN